MIGVLIRCAVLCFATLGLASASPAASAIPQISYTKPGRAIDVGGFKLNLRCFGSGRPTVVFDAGLSDWSPAWSTVQPVIARTTRACSYDRAGNGFSEAGPLPRTSDRIVRELHTLLERSGEKPPYLLVGHSFGSFNMRLYADRYLGQVAGIVLIDGSHEDQGALIDPTAVADFERQLAACDRAANDRPMRPKQRADCAQLYFRGLPERRFTPQLNAVLEAQAETAKQARATLSEMQSFGARSADEVRAAKRSYGHIPLRILTATNHRYPGSKKSAAYWHRWEAAWHALHDTWLPLSTDSREIMAVGSGHYIQFDQTPLVIETIEAVIARVRATHPA